MVDRLQNDGASAKQFLNDVNTKLDGTPAKDRQLETSYLLSKLEKEGKLPQLMLNAGLGDTQSTLFKATTFGGRQLDKETVKGIAETGANGPLKFDAGTQLLMSGLVRKLGDKPTLNTTDIRNWVNDETRTGVKHDGDIVKSPVNQYVNVMRQFDTPAKLKAAFGSETPSRDEIKKALDRQQDIQNVLNSVGPEATEAARKNGRLWSTETKAAAEYLANEDNYNRVQGAKSESYKPWTNGDWVSSDKIKELGKNTFKTTIDQADAKEKRKSEVTAEVDDLGKKLDAKYAAKPAEGGKASESETKLKQENDALKQKLEEQEARLKRMEALLERLAGGKAPEAKKEEPKKEEAKKEEPKKEEAKKEEPKKEEAKKEEPKKEEAKKEEPKKEEAKKEEPKKEEPKKEEAKKEEPKKEEAKKEEKKSEVAPDPKKKPDVDWAAVERQNEAKLLEFLNKKKTP